MRLPTAIALTAGAVSLLLASQGLAASAAAASPARQGVSSAPLVDSPGTPPPASPGAETSLPAMSELIARALDNDAGLRSRRLDGASVGQEVPMARSRLLPRLEASANYRVSDADNIYTDNPQDYPDEVYDDRISGRTQDTSWQVRLTQPLFDLERSRQLGKAHAQADAATLEVAVAERDLAMTVIDTYLDAYRASRRVGLLMAQRESLTLQQRQAQRAYDLGLGDRINLLESQSRLDQAIADQTAAENALSIAITDLERLTGVTPDFTPRLIERSATFTPGAEDQPLESLLTRSSDNADVRLAAQRENVTRQETDIRRAARYPRLDFVVDYSDLHSNDALRTSRELSAGVELNVALYQGGYTTASIRQGELTALAGAADLDNERRLAQQEVRRRLRSIQGDRRQLEALTRSIESASLFVEAAVRGEALGLRDLVDVLDARATLYDLRIRYVDTLCDYLDNRAALAAATGTLDTPSIDRLMRTLEALEREADPPAIVAQAGVATPTRR
ncbi:TolC family protein [Salinicola aestuarinus]|uniref:TolC family protein n=1 Tax=Salinicola aestuarinus TaxID=1949082 RepID=UPI00165FDA2A|nr:TolC family protein [Salinicola aestuarinus]